MARIAGLPPVLDVILLLALAALLAWWGGTPWYHPDALVEKALRALAASGRPEMFNYPALTLYLIGFATRALSVLLNVQDAIPVVDWYLAATRAGGASHLLVNAPGHLVTLSFGLIGIASTWYCAWRLANSRWAAMAAGLLLCTTPLWVVNSHFLTVDISMAALSVSCIAFNLCRGIGRAPLANRDLLLIGALCGLTASAKYNGALVLLAPFVASRRGYQDGWQWTRHMVMLTATAVVSFLATNPFIVVEPRRFLTDLLFEARHAAGGHPGFSSDEAWWFHLTTSLPATFGWPGLLLIVVGSISLAQNPQVARSDKLALLAFPLATFLVIGSARLAFHRYCLPMLPYAAIVSALALHRLVALCSGIASRRRRALAAALATVLFAVVSVPPARISLLADRLLTRVDTRLVLARMLTAADLSGGRETIFAGP